MNVMDVIINIILVFSLFIADGLSAAAAEAKAVQPHPNRCDCGGDDDFIIMTEEMLLLEEATEVACEQELSRLVVYHGLDLTWDVNVFEPSVEFSMLMADSVAESASVAARVCDGSETESDTETEVDGSHETESDTETEVDGSHETESDTESTESTESTENTESPQSMSAASVSQALFAKYRSSHPVLSAHTTIQWNRVCVLGWPQQVTFYRAKHWRRLDVELLAAALDEISFVLDPRVSGGIFTSEDKAEVGAELLRLVEQVYPGSRLDWRVLKGLVPELHLSNPRIGDMNSRDLLMVKRVISVLQARVQGYSQGLAQTETQAYAYAQISHVDVMPLDKWRHKVFNQLLTRFRDTCAIVANRGIRIPWSKVDVLGWPPSVIFYSKDRWSGRDCRALLESMPQIRFIRDFRPVERIPDAYKAALYEELSDLIQARLGGEKTCRCCWMWWDYIKQLRSDFHLCQIRHRYWSDKDVRMVESVIETLKSIEETPSAQSSSVACDGEQSCCYCRNC